MRTMMTALAAAAVMLLVPAAAAAHCDTLDGPVVKAAQRALDANDLSPALIWIAPAAEPELRAAFASTREVRALGPAAKALADRYFFETLVRLHRAGESEPYTGLKPAGTATPAVRAADLALERGSIAALARLLADALHQGLEARFEAARHAKDAAAPGDAASGRAFVKAYVEFMHDAERLHEAAAGPAGGHPEATPPAH
jgi:hypothetical protein